MKRIITLLTFLMVILTAFSQEQMLVITHTDGTTTTFQLSTKPKVTFSGGKVTVMSSTIVTEYAAGDVARFNYVLPTGIAQMITDEMVSATDEYVIFSGDIPLSSVHLFTSGGIQIPVTFLSMSSGVALNISSLNHGAYIISFNGKTLKFSKR
jgi:hypothetical protein